MKQFTIYNLQFTIKSFLLILFAFIFTLYILHCTFITPIYAQTGRPTAPTVTWNDISCLPNITYSDSELTISWTNQTWPIVQVNINYSSGEDDIQYDKKVSPGTTSTTAPEGFTTSTYGLPQGVFRQDERYSVATVDQLGYISPEVYISPLPLCPAPTCSSYSIALSASPNPVYVDETINFTITGDTSKMINNYDDMGYILGRASISGGATECTALSFDNFTCFARGNASNYTWTHYWQFCEGTPPRCSPECSKSLNYTIMYRPRPDTPTVCRNPDYSNPLGHSPPVTNNVTYQNEELTVNRTNIQNPIEWIYITGPAPDYYLISKQITQNQTSIPAPVGFSNSLYSGISYQAFVCSRSSADDPRWDPNWNKYCSGYSNNFCLDAENTTSNCTSGKNPSPCPTPIPVYCGTGEARATGLVSSPTLAGNFGSTGACIIDQKAAFAPYEIPTYDDLKSIYYTQAKSSDTSVKEPPQASKPIKLDGAKDHIYNITEDLTISSPSDITGNQTGVIFVDGNLTIGPIPGNKLTTGASVGLVFVVEDDVNIDPTVTQIDAVIISSGKIYTAGSGCTHTSPVSGSQLVINGGLVSLGDGNIEFCRTLSDNNTAAEKIVHQSKYLIILRDLFARNEQFWSEVQ